MQEGKKIDKKLGGKIRELRERMGMSQQEFAQKLGYKTDTAIYLIEKGKRGISVDRLKRVAEIFKVSLSDLILTGDKKEDIDMMTALRSDKQLNENDIKQISNFVDFLKSQDER